MAPARAEVAHQPGTVQEALVWALGVDLYVRSPAQADVAIRGGSFEQVLVLVDGARVSDAQIGHVDLDVSRMPSPGASGARRFDWRPSEPSRLTKR